MSINSDNQGATANFYDYQQSLDVLLQAGIHAFHARDLAMIASEVGINPSRVATFVNALYFGKNNFSPKFWNAMCGYIGAWIKDKKYYDWKVPNIDVSFWNEEMELLISPFSVEEKQEFLMALAPAILGESVEYARAFARALAYWDSWGVDACIEVDVYLTDEYNIKPHLRYGAKFLASWLYTMRPDYFVSFHEEDPTPESAYFVQPRTPKTTIRLRAAASALRRNLRYEQWKQAEQERQWLNACAEIGTIFTVPADPPPPPVQRPPSPPSWWLNSSDLAFQSGMPTDRASRRAQREAHQRKVAREKVKAAYKSTPKQTREDNVKAQRDKRNPAVEQQSGILKAAGYLVAGGLATKLFGLLNRSNKLVDRANDFMSHFEGIVKGARKHAKELWYIPVVLVSAYVMRIDAWKAAASTLLIPALRHFVGPVWSAIANFFPSGDSVADVVCQSGIEGFSFGKLIAAMLTFSALGKKVSAQTVDSLCRRMGSFDRISDGWDSFSKCALDAIRVALDWLVQRFGGTPRFYKKQKDVVLEWAKKVDQAFCAHQVVERQVDQREITRMIELFKEGTAYREVNRGTKAEKYINEYLMKLVSLIQPYQGAISARDNFRMEPPCCVFVGKPGIGKTRLAMPFCASILLETGLFKDLKNASDIVKEIWQKGSSEYWNGYAGQACLVLDDAFQNRVVPGDVDNDYMNIIRMVSSWSYPLNFADLASKGRIFFNSKLIFGTTNTRALPAEASQVITEPSAVIRRIRYAYELEVKAEFMRDGMLDMEKFKAELAACRSKEGSLAQFPWHIWELHEHDFATGISSNVPIPVTRVIRSIADDIRQRVEHHDDDLSVLEGLFDGYRSTSTTEVKSDTQFQAGPTQFGDSAAWPDSAAVGACYWGGLEAVLKEQEEEASRWCKWLLRIQFSGALVVAFALVFQAVWTLCKGFFKLLTGKRKTADAQSNRKEARAPDRTTLVQKTYKEHIKLRASNPVLDVGFQSGNEKIHDKMYRNVYHVAVETSDTRHCLGQATFLEHSLCVMPLHFKEDFKERISTGEFDRDTLVHFENGVTRNKDFSRSLGALLSLPCCEDQDTDTWFVNFTNVNCARAITHLFLKEEDLKSIGGHRGRLEVNEREPASPSEKVGSELNAYMKRWVWTLPSLRLERNLNIPFRRKIARYVSYKAPTRAGHCGALLTLYDNTHFGGRTALGYHVAGSKSCGEGYATILTQEMIVAAKRKLALPDDEFVEDLTSRGIQLQIGDALPFENPGSFLPIGQVDRKVILSPKSSYYRIDDMYGELGDYKYFPAPLRPVMREGELKRPMDNAVAPYSTPVKIFDCKWLDMAVYTAMYKFTDATRDFSRRIYTFDEAVLGVPAEKFRSIPRRTSPGYPYVLDHKVGKTDFFGKDVDYDLTSEHTQALRQRVDHIISKARDNKRLAHVFVDFLKDELRSEAKVEQVATRLISSSPLDYTIAVRMYFGAFCAAMMKTNTSSGLCPGICTYTDWDKLVKVLSEKGEDVFDGDFKAFDSSEQNEVHWALLRFINSWYNDGPENQRIRTVLFYDLVHSRHLGGPGDDQCYVYQWLKSLPSGHPLTTIINSMYSGTMLVGAYTLITGDFLHFHEHVSFAVYGDDNVVNVVPELAPVFNQVTVAKALQSFGMTYTSGSKDGNWVPYTTIDKVAFLKRGFLLEDGQWLCPLALESFLYTCYWGKNHRLESVILKDVLEMALEELSLHPIAVWEKWAPEVIRLMGKRGFVPKVLPERSAYQRVIQSRTDNWY